MGKIKLLAVFFLLCGVCLAASLPNKPVRNKPKPVRDSLIHLEQAGVLSYDRGKSDAQILVKDVRFRHNGAIMTCDSANFYERNNSFRAYGRVKMIQGDTLELVGDTLDYDGNLLLAKVWGKSVVLTHWKDKRKKDKTVLKTRHLDYDRVYDVGYFYDDGELDDQDNVLTSDWGEYSTAEREASFYYNVKLTNPKFLLMTDTLYYNTNTENAHFMGPSNVFRVVNKATDQSEMIYSRNGYYNTRTEYARLLGPSVVKNPERIVVGQDSLIYNKQTGEGRGYRNTVLTDLKNKNQLQGDYCYYNDSLGTAIATGRAVAKDFSQEKSDTLFLHADSLKMFSYNLDTDSLYRIMHAYKHVRAYRSDVQCVADSMVYNQQLKRLGMFQDPVVWNNDMQLLGDSIYVWNNDSTIEWAHVIGQALSVEMQDSIHYNQVAGKEIKAYFENGNINLAHVIDNVDYAYYPLDKDSTMVGFLRGQVTELKFFMAEKKLMKIWAGSGNEGTMYPLLMVPDQELKLKNFVWLDYIRPKNKEDIFNWIPKKEGDKLQVLPKRSAPVVNLNKRE